MNEQTAQSQLQIGMPAPDITLTNVQAESVQLADLWPSGPTLLTFLRHFG